MGFPPDCVPLALAAPLPATSEIVSVATVVTACHMFREDAYFAKKRTTILLCLVLCNLENVLITYNWQIILFCNMFSWLIRNGERDFLLSEQTLTIKEKIKTFHTPIPTKVCFKALKKCTDVPAF